MAKVKITMPDGFIDKLSSLGTQTDAIFSEALKAGAEVVLEKMKSRLDASVGKGTKYESRSTGELKRSLGITSVLVDKDGNYNIKVGFAEPRKNGDSNAKLANIIEYGKHGQPAKPFLKPTKSAAKSAAEAAMKSKLEEAFGRL